MDWLSPIREVFGFISPFLERFPVVRAILGFILVFFLPGFVWTLIFFRQLNVLERIVFSFGLSIAIVTLSILLANVVFGMRISGFNSVLVIIVITILPVAIYYLKRLVKRSKKKAAE
jgi:uncharacterized membrane protein